MLGNTEFFWKNFKLGTELQISGAFLYNAISIFDKMEHFKFEEESFEFLYNASVGIERLAKVAIILLEHHVEIDQKEFEKSLITHNHEKLINRIRKIEPIAFGQTHLKFLEVLSHFYKSTRYDRFSISSVSHLDHNKPELITFIEQELKMEIETESIFPTEINTRIKIFVGKTISFIATKLYKLIESRARELQIYTHEIASDSKAYKIFIEEEYTFENEKIFQKEILLYLLKLPRDDTFKEFMDTLEPLPLDFHSTNDYVKYILDFHKHRIILDELKFINDQTEFDRERVEAIKLIGEDFGCGEDHENEF